MKKKVNFMNLSAKKQDESKTVKFTVKEKDGVVVCQLTDRMYGKKFTGKTRVHDMDTWSEKKGRAIAFQKARRSELSYNIRQCEAELQYLKDLYETEVHRIEKRKELNEIYLAGANMELDELLGRSVNESDVNNQD